MPGSAAVEHVRSARNSEWNRKMNISNRLFFTFSVFVLFKEMNNSFKQKFCSVFFSSFAAW